MALDRKEIALSIGGVLATMALAYLLYRLQQRDAATAAATAANNAAAVNAANEEAAQYAYESSGGGSYGINVPSVSSSSVDTSAQTSATTSEAPTQSDTALAQIIADFATSIQAGNNAPTPTVESMLIPTVGLATQPSGDIPVSADSALYQAGYTAIGSQPSSTPSVSNPKDTHISSVVS